GGAGDRLPLRWADGRGRDRAPERDERDGASPLGALVLIRTGAAGSRAEGVERRARQRRLWPGRLPAPGEDERSCPVGELLAGDGDEGRRVGVVGTARDSPFGDCPYE